METHVRRRGCDPRHCRTACTCLRCVSGRAWFRASFFGAFRCTRSSAPLPTGVRRAPRPGASDRTNRGESPSTCTERRARRARCPQRTTAPGFHPCRVSLSPDFPSHEARNGSRRNRNSLISMRLNIDRRNGGCGFRLFSLRVRASGRTSRAIHEIETRVSVAISLVRGCSFSQAANAPTVEGRPRTIRGTGAVHVRRARRGRCRYAC